MTETEVSEIISENKKRLALNARPYNQLTGEGCDACERRKVHIDDAPIPYMWLPVQMFDFGIVKQLAKLHSIKKLLKSKGIPQDDKHVELFWREFVKLRIRYDFEYWCICFVKIKHKITNKDVALSLNRGQRKLLKALMADHLSGKPCRIILCKSRQWGGSTLTQVYFAWLQLVVHKQWNSAICAHVEDAARKIRAMYTKIIRNYPRWLIDNTTSPLSFANYEGSHKTKYLAARDCRLGIGSAEKPDGLRGDDLSLCHLSEVGLWRATAQKKPEDLMQSLQAGVALIPDSVIVIESTAKGVGNFFHREWLDAKNGINLSTPVFVAWFEIDMYSEHIASYRAFIETMTDYEHYLFSLGATLEAIAWYRQISKTFADKWRLMSEFPATDVEAFQSTGHRFYPIEDVQRLRATVRRPNHIGEVVGSEITGRKALDNLKFQEASNGELKVWSLPDTAPKVTDRYVVVVDIGGRSDAADRSVICVFDRYYMQFADVPEVVAEWCGHCDHDILAWKAAQVAKFYHNALLVIESNTFEMEGTEGDHMEFIFDELAGAYDNLYCRTPSDQIRQGVPPRWGFHTNHSTKQLVCNHQKKALREGLYIERCAEACDEHDTFEIKANGKMDAVEGCHDDRHITRAIGVWLCYKLDLPQPIKEERGSYSRRIASEATI